jgi:hypothetical protein
MDAVKTVTATFTNPNISVTPSPINSSGINTISPDIKINNEDGPIMISRTSIISVSVSLSVGISSGIYADWWAIADTPFGWYYYVYPYGWYYAPDLEDSQPAYQGPLFDLMPVELINITDLPSGTYTVYCGVDTIMNGQLDSDYFYYDSVTADVTY